MQRVARTGSKTVKPPQYLGCRSAAQAAPLYHPGSIDLYREEKK